MSDACEIGCFGLYLSLIRYERGGEGCVLIGIPPKFGL